MDKETRWKIIKAVGEIIKKEGFQSLNISKIARVAGVDRKTVSRKYKSLNEIIEAFVLENDYWMIFFEKVSKISEEHHEPQSLITEILQNQFRFFFTEKEMQDLILTEISCENPLMRSIHNTRESYAQKYLELTDPHFEGSDVNFNAVSGLLVGGIYYMVLHARFNGGVFAGVDIHSEQGRNQILTAIQQIVDWAFRAAASK